VGFADLIYVSSDVGVGGGIITSGRPLVGASGYAGEVGHFPVDPDGATCGCGSRGCWETVVGLQALLRRAGRDPDAGPEEVAAVMREAEEGGVEAIDALVGVGRWMGVGLAGLVNVFDPEIVVLGGLFSVTAPFTLPVVRRQLEDRKLAHTRESVEVVTSRLGADGPVLGAAERAFEPLLADPAAPTPVAARSRARQQTGAAM
jgi:predicted NBD/HSP70 family sugar kinase